MLSPNPLSLFCAILLALPIALFLTVTSHRSLSPHPHVTLSPPLTPPPFPPPPLPIPPFKKEHINTTNTSIPSPNSPSPPPPPPRYPEDDKDDVELLLRASRVDTKTNPGAGPRKLAFLFLTTAPLPFAPVWERFFNRTEAQGRYNIYIHTDPGVNTSVFTGVFQGRVIPSSKPTSRNTPTLVAAARRLLAEALLHDPNNYMFTLVSSACIPLHSFNFTYSTLTSSNESFIEILSNEKTAYSRWAARGDKVMFPEVPLEVFRIGSQFWSLTRHHALLVVEDVVLWRKFRLPCVDIGVCFPEENYFPTLLSMVDLKGAVPATLTNVNWDGGSNGHPRTYNVTEVGPELIRWLRGVRPRYGDVGINGSGSGLDVKERWDPFLFARKFEPNCVEALLNITSDVLFKE